MSPAQFLVRWEGHPGHLMGRLGKLVEQQKFADVMLVCEQQSVKAHRVVLAACSPYFEALLESQAGPTPTLVFNDMRFSILKALVEFMYSGETSVTQKDLVGLLRSAEHFQIKGLCEVAADSLEPLTTIERKTDASNDVDNEDQTEETVVVIDGTSTAKDDDNQDAQQASTSTARLLLSLAAGNSGSTERVVLKAPRAAPGSRATPYGRPGQKKCSIPVSSSVSPIRLDQSMQQTAGAAKSTVAKNEHNGSGDVVAMALSDLEDSTAEVSILPDNGVADIVVEDTVEEDSSRQTFLANESHSSLSGSSRGAAADLDAANPEATSGPDGRLSGTPKRRKTLRSDPLALDCANQTSQKSEEITITLPDGTSLDDCPPGTVVLVRTGDGKADNAGREDNTLYVTTCEDGQLMDESEASQEVGQVLTVLSSGGPIFKSEPTILKKGRRAARQQTAADGSRPVVQKRGNPNRRTQHEGFILIEEIEPTKPGEPPKRTWECVICKKHYHFSFQLTIHRRFHSGDRPYVCEVCKKGFTCAGDLRRHDTMHKGDRPYRCEHCDKRFKLKSQVGTHVSRVHLNLRPHKCNVCGSGFTDSSKLKSHTMVHTGDRPFQCPDCQKAFRTHSKVKEHVRAVHCSWPPIVLKDKEGNDEKKVN